MEREERQSARTPFNFAEFLRPVLQRLYMPRLGPIPVELMERLKRIESALAKRPRE